MSDKVVHYCKFQSLFEMSVWIIESLLDLFSNPKICTPPRKLIRYSSGGTNTYEGDGKTSVQILNKELDLGLMINSFSQVGFRLNNGMMILGPMAIFPK